MEWSPRLSEMETQIERRLPRNKHCIHTIAKEIRKRLAFDDWKDRPLGKFLLVGPPDSVDNIAVELADFVFGDATAVLRLNMEDFREKYNVQRLFCSPGGLARCYVDGLLTEPIWCRPGTVVHLAGIEKAHHDVWQPLLTIMEKGQILEWGGRTTSFRDSILIVSTMLGYAPDSDDFSQKDRSAIEVEIPAEALHQVSCIVRCH